MTLWTDGLHLAQPGVRLRALAAYLAAALVLVLPLVLAGPTLSPASRVLSAQIDDGRGGWREADLTALTLPAGRVSTLRAQVWVDPALVGSGKPVGLYLSGTFAAEASWNGAAVGSKGRAGASATLERPGPIDAILLLPAERVRAGKNELVLRLSSAHLAYPVRTVIHGSGELFGVRVGPFSGEARRPISYYAAPFFMSGVLLLGCAVLVLRGEGRTAGCVILGALAIAALAEVSRSVVNYPYPLQGPRILAVTLAVNAAAGAIFLQARAVSGLDDRRRLTLALVAAAVALATLAPTSLLGSGQAFLFATLASAVIAGWGAVRRRPSAAELTAALVLMTAFGLLDGQAFLDRSLYAAAAPLVAHLVWRPPPAAPAPPSSVAVDRLAIGSSEARRFIPHGAIRAIHGAGDYAELRLAGGQRVLASETLQALTARLPDAFMRTHRSHIVNLAHVTALRGESGGRYRLQLTDGDWLPVARSRVAELRARLR